MLILVEAEAHKKNAQQALERRVKESLRRQGKLNIGFPSGNMDEVIYADGDGTLWCAFTTADEARIPRNWNAFGVFDGSRPSQIITVEINIPIGNNSGLVSGFFAKDPASGRVFLMHDGGVGGGRKGVGRSAFLAWSKSNLVSVAKSDGTQREGIVVGDVGAADLAARLWRFVKLVREFKLAVRSGELDDAAVTRIVSEWEDFGGVGGGQRKGVRQAEVDYITYHDDVVLKLYQERKAKQATNERIIYNRLIDLYVRTDGTITELYEVKTKLDTQSIYTGIGQLMAHSAETDSHIERTLVVPEGQLPGNLEKALSSLAIALRRFTITAGKEPTVQLS